MTPQQMSRLIGAAIVIFVIVIVASQSTAIVKPGDRGVKVTLGKVSPQFLHEGFHLKAPFITNIESVTIRQQTRDMKADCYSSDLQQVNTQLRVLYRVPEKSVVRIFQNYAGDPFDTLIAPRVHEALKEVAALRSAEQIVKTREEIKSQALELAQRKIGVEFLTVVDVVIQEIALSRELESAIEAKMVQEQEAAKSRFIQQKSQIEAETAVIRAKGEAESISIRGQALRENPSFIELQIVEKWDGKTPLVIGGGTTQGPGTSILLPVGDFDRTSPVRDGRPSAAR